MNRRSFIKSSGLVIGGVMTFPFLSFGRDNRKRSPKSLFTIREMREWCEKNGFKYLEDSDIQYPTKHKPMKVYYPDKNDETKYYFVYKRWPFLCSRPPFYRQINNFWYEALNWNALDWKFDLKHFFLYDIVDTTLDSQREKGEFYSMIDCGIHRIKDDEVRLVSRKRKMSDMTRNQKIWDIQKQCWLKPKLNTDDEWWYWNGFEAI
jgi:hypothetical protein